MTEYVGKHRKKSDPITEVVHEWMQNPVPRCEHNTPLGIRCVPCSYNYPA